jgi:hypothetical protein
MQTKTSYIIQCKGKITTNFNTGTKNGIPSISLLDTQLQKAFHWFQDDQIGELQWLQL